MVKHRISLILSFSAIAMCLAAAPFSFDGGMKEDAKDYLANRGHRLLELSAQDGEAEFEYSKTFAQSGQNAEGQYVLRFATAVKGDIENLSYTRFALENAPAGSAQAQDNLVPVTTLYRSIQDGEGSAYYNGVEVVHEPSEFTEDWYWACYSITFTSSKYYGADIRVQLTVNDVEVEARTMSLNKVRLPNMEAYEGNKYSSGDVYFEVVDKYTAKATYNGFEVEAAITDEQGEYLVFGDSYNGFKAHIQGSTAFVKDFVYEGEKKTQGTYYPTLLVKLTSFSMSFSSSSQYTDPVEEGATYDVQVGDTKYMYIYTNSDASYSISYKTTDDSRAVEMNSGKSGSTPYVSVKFKEAGEATVIVTLEDPYGTKKPISAKFSAVEKIYPTQDNWEITKDITGDEITVGSQIQFGIEWLAEIPNVEYKVNWTLEFESEEKIAEIINNNLNKQNGLLTARGEGEVKVIATVSYDNGKYSFSKPCTITILPAGEDDVLPADVCGEWVDDYGDFTFTVSRDGTAVMELYDEEFHFNFTGMHNSYYVFVCEEDSDIELELWVKSLNSANLAPTSGEDIFIGSNWYYMAGYGVDMSK